MRRCYMFAMLSFFLPFSSSVSFSSTNGFEYVSPRPGSGRHRRETNIIIRKGEVIDAATVTADTRPSVTGSASGSHEGAWLLSDDVKTLVFNPSSTFALGETVDVSLPGGIRTSAGTDIGPMEFTFTIMAGPGTIGRGSYPERSFSGWPEVTGFDARTLSSDTLPSDFPTISVVYSDNPSPDPVFLANIVFNANVPNTPHVMVVNNQGFPLAYARQNSQSFDFKTQPNGMLTCYNQNLGGYLVMDHGLNVVDTIKGKNGYSGDPHELRILPNGHALFIAVDPQAVAMDSIIPGGNSNATVLGAIIQELDTSRNVVFQWRSWDYFQITDATHENLFAQTIDYVHANSLEVEGDGNILLSCRHMDEVTKINRRTGDIIWRLGGRHNEFTFINDGIGFSHQHAVRRLADGHITMFDNGNFHSPVFSRAVEYVLDERGHTATLVWQYRHSPDLYGSAMGYVQRLENGNTLIGWGSTNPSVTEVRPDGSVAFELTLPQYVFSYRAYRLPFEAVTGTSIREDFPHGFSLAQNYPNPFNPATTIQFTIPAGIVAPSSLRVYDMLGRNVVTLLDQQLRPGTYSVRFDASQLPSGAYFYRLQAGSMVETKKLVVVR